MAASNASVKNVSLLSFDPGTWICLYFGAIIFESSTPLILTTSVVVMHASVRQSKMHATASSGNSISHPTEQSKHFDTHVGFFLLLLLLLLVNLASAWELATAGLEFELEADAEVDVDGTAFDVEAP
jgi:hypothetical protein